MFDHVMGKRHFELRYHPLNCFNPLCIKKYFESYP